MIPKEFPICDQLLQCFGTCGFIRANPVYSSLFVVYLWKYFFIPHANVYIYIYIIKIKSLLWKHFKIKNFNSIVVSAIVHSFPTNYSSSDGSKKEQEWQPPPAQWQPPPRQSSSRMEENSWVMPIRTTCCNEQWWLVFIPCSALLPFCALSFVCR
jgi:hypothetical protein